ncbi:hypothetical protein EVAR_69550_1 [Eumeta japonica]|uniref:FLYWCH-type domain-containing protein n=1 Tax=Eumeta variegata TaxID=151549 RepID=A0A4C2A6W0_EUMVA|nr:hypothetical protein EVAR_69550_1 [Eumeta japonica]
MVLPVVTMGAGRMLSSNMVVPSDGYLIVVLVSWCHEVGPRSVTKIKFEDEFAESLLGNNLDSGSECEEEPVLGDGSQLIILGSDNRDQKCPKVGPATPAQAWDSSRRPAPSMQYTLSNRGSLQMILNRYMYYVKYCSKRSGMRQWRCVDYIDHRCPATVVTKDDAVLKRLVHIS